VTVLDQALDLILQKEIPGQLPKTIQHKLDATILRLASKPGNLDLHYQVNTELIGLKDKTGPMFNIEFI